MEIKFIPITKDLIDTNRTAFRSKIISYVLFVSLFYFLPIFLAFIFIFFIHPLNIFNIVFMLAIPAAFYNLTRYFALQHRASPSLRGEHIYSLKDDEINLKGPGFDNKVEWPLLDKCIKSKTTYLIYSGKLPLISIPLRVLNVEQQAQLNELLAAKGL